MKPTVDSQTEPPHGKARVFLALALLQDPARSVTSADLAGSTRVTKSTIRHHLKRWVTAGTVERVPVSTDGPGAANRQTYAVTPKGVAALRTLVQDEVYDGTCLAVAARLNLSVVKAMGAVPQPQPSGPSTDVKPVRRLQLVRPPALVPESIRTPPTKGCQ